MIIAIDPFGCGCTECLVGEYTPLDRANWQQVVSMIMGRLRDNTSETFTYRDGVISAGYSGLTWERE